MAGGKIKGKIAEEGERRIKCVAKVNNAIGQRKNVKNVGYSIVR